MQNIRGKFGSDEVTTCVVTENATGRLVWTNNKYVNMLRTVL